MLTILAGLALLLLSVLTWLRKPNDLPPGSFGWPIIGSIPPMHVHLSVHLESLRKKYGSIFTTKWGSRIVVAITDVNLIKKAMALPQLQDRPDLYSFQIFFYFQNLGILSANGTVWMNNRRFFLRNLKDFGMGKSRLEDSIQEEARMLVKHFEKTALDSPTEVDMGLNVAVLNVIWQMLAGKRYEADDTVITTFNKMIQEDFAIMQEKLFILDFFPWLAKVLPRFVIRDVLKSGILEERRDLFIDMCKKIIKEHEETLDPNNPRDVLDNYIAEVKGEKTEYNSTFREDYLDLALCMTDLFVAGSETTSTTLRWLILYMAMYPEIQHKVHKIIDEVVPSDRLPSLEDKPKLVYIEAVLMEVMRLSSLAITAAPHCPAVDIQFEGYRIPKGAMVLACLEHCHKNPQYWERPNEFYPEHFLDADGKLITKKDAFMPFGIGRRECLGEALARMELYIFAAALLHNFIIAAPPGVVLQAESVPEQKLMNVPKPFKVVFKKRF